MRSRLTEKLAKVWKTHIHHMARPEEDQIDMHTKMECQMYFSKNILRVNPVVMNYKIRHIANKKRPARYNLACPDHFSH